MIIQIKHNKSNGFSLLEVMIALVIFSIGLLGLAGLMSQSLSYNNSSQYRTQATFLAYDMLDRMRSNRTQASDPTLGYNIDWGVNPGAASCYNTNCTASALANSDKTQWKDALGNLLPDGDGRVTDAVVGTSPIFLIEIRWSDPAASSGTSQFNLRTEL